MKVKFLIIFILFFIFIVFVFSNDNVLVLKDGREYKGTLIKIENEKIFFEINGKVSTFKKDQVSKINFQQKRMYEDIGNINQIKDKEIIEIWNNSKKWNPDPDIQVVILLDKITYNFDKNNEVKIRIKKSMKILNEDAKQLSTQYFYYMHDNFSAKLLYGFTILPDGKISTVEEQAVNDEPINNHFTQYDKLNRVKFGLKNIDVGSVFVWEAEIKGHYNELNQPFFIEKNLQTEFQIGKRILEINTSNKLKTIYTPGLINYKKPEIKTISVNRNNNYQIIENNLEEFVNDEDNTPSNNIIYPYLYAGFVENWENLSNKYYEKYFSKPVNDKVKTLTNKLIKNEKNPDKIIKIIYEYINRSIDLVGIPLDECGYTPIDESKILNYSGLSILDKSYLFTRMAKTQGINIKFLLYRSNDRSNLINEIPSLKQFDSVVCEAQIGGNKTLISFSNENFNIGQTYYNTSNAESLELSSKNSKPVKLQEIDIEKNKTEINYNCKLNDDNSISITRTSIINGSNQVGWRGKRFQSREELDKWAKSRMTGLGGDAVIESYKFINDLADFDKPVIFEEKIKINNFSFSSGENLKLFKIPDLNYKAGNVNKEERNFPFDFGKTGITVNNYNLTIPDSYKFLYIPQSLDLIYDGFSFKANYSTENNKLNLTIETLITKTIIPVQKYNEVKNWYEKRADFSNQWIMIEK